MTSELVLITTNNIILLTIAQFLLTSTLMLFAGLSLDVGGTPANRVTCFGRSRLAGARTSCGLQSEAPSLFCRLLREATPIGVALEKVSFQVQNAVEVRATSLRYSAPCSEDKMIKKTVAVVEVPVQSKVSVLEPKEPTEQEIAVRAHELFLKRGAVGGHELEDWLEAERELRHKD